MVIILNVWIFKLSDIDQGIYKHPHTYEIGIFSVFEEKIWSQKKIKANIIVSRTTLCTQKIKFCMHKNFFEKCLFAYEIRFAVEKKNKKFLGQIFKITWKSFVSPSKKCQSYNFLIWELYDKHFFSKN